jgi:hypothetical protein
MSRRRHDAGGASLLLLVLIALLGGAGLGAALALGTQSRPNRSHRESSSSNLPTPPRPSGFGTPAEIGTRGDRGNPGAIYAGDYPSDSETQERTVGGPPARFSGYTTWVRSVSRVPARTLVDGYPGDYLKLHVTVFNRDTEEQHVCACDFSVWSRTDGQREADVVPAPSIARYSTMQSGETLDGDVYLYVGTTTGPLFAVYRPDNHVFLAASESRGVWRVG